MYKKEAQKRPVTSKRKVSKGEGST